MLLVKTKLCTSSIHGLGIFAAENIEKGRIVWEYREPFDRQWSKNYVESLPVVSREYVKHFCALLHNGNFLVTGDNDRFWNHSNNPNCLTDCEAKTTVALRNIKEGEEMTEDYSMYCSEEKILFQDQ